MDSDQAMMAEAPDVAVRRLIDNNFPALAEVKRFLERWRADPRFREGYERDSAHALAGNGFQLDAEDLSLLVGSASDVRLGSLGEVIQHLSQALSAVPTATEEQDQRLSHAFTNARFDAWRHRQIGRLRSQQLLRGYDDIGHLPAAFELTNGCSVGCWFCSLAPEKLTQVFAYTDDNAALWKDILTGLRDRIGPGVSESFCYWATDPFDNPDYERFLTDFHGVHGTLPRTTTALAWRDPERARRLLEKTKTLGGGVRFSVLSLGMLKKIHAAFTPIELANVNLVMQMNGAIGSPKSRAGAARHHPKAAKEDLSDDYAPSTVTGFVVNMPAGTVELVSPCLPTERWPNGHRVHARGQFATAEEFDRLVCALIAEHMPARFDEQDDLRFRPDLKFSPTETGFQLSTRVNKFTFRHSTFPTSALGGLIADGGHRVGEVVDTLASSGQPARDVLRHLTTLFDAGFLDDGL